MTAKQVLIGLIAATTAICCGLLLVSGAVTLAAGALVIGGIWLYQVTRNVETSGSWFFLAFLGMAIWAGLHGLPGPVVVLAFSVDLAAWDVTRFLDRARAGTNATNEAARNIDPVMESRHLQRLAITIGAGFVVALVPFTAKLSVSFVGLAVVTLLAVILLRQAVIYLRNEG